MKRAILHIGYPKTATTWFQSRFYPRLRDFRYIPQQTVHLALRNGQGPVFSAERARRMIAEVTDGEYVALCKEGLSGDPKSGGNWGALDPDTVAERLWVVFGDSGEVVVLVRNQLSALVATYGQYLKRGGSHPPRRYMLPPELVTDSGDAQGKLDLQHFDYDRLIARYEALFGAGRVHVFAYEQLLEDPQAFLRAFAQRLALGPVPEISLRRRNAGYGRRIYVLARGLNRLGAGRTPSQGWHVPILPHSVRKGILNACGRLPFAGPAPQLDWLVGAEAAEALAKRFVDGNRRLAERHGLALRRFGYPGFR